MGKLHWCKHALKPAPVEELDVDETFRIVIRDRGKPSPRLPKDQRFVASIVYRHPPVKGLNVLASYYAATLAQVRMKVLNSIYLTHLVNVRRGRSGEPQSLRTHCPKGHPYDENNTYWYTPKGRLNAQRSCRECMREATRRWLGRQKEPPM